MSESHDRGAYDRKRQREAKGRPGAKRDDLDPETVLSHHKPPDSDAPTSAVAIEMPHRKRTQAVQKADFVEIGERPSTRFPSPNVERSSRVRLWEPLSCRM